MTIEHNRYEAVIRRQSEIYDRIMREQRQERNNTNSENLNRPLEVQQQQEQQQQQGELPQRHTLCHPDQADESPPSTCDSNEENDLAAKIMHRIQLEQVELFDRIQKEHNNVQKQENCVSDETNVTNYTNGATSARIYKKGSTSAANEVTSSSSLFGDIEIEQQRILEEIQKNTNNTEQNVHETKHVSSTKRACPDESLSVISSLSSSSAASTNLERRTSLKRKSLDGVGRAFILERSTSRQRLSIVQAETQSSSSSSSSSWKVDDDDNGDADGDEKKEFYSNNLKKEEQQQQQQQQEDFGRRQLIRLKSFQNAIQMIHSLPSEVEQKEKVYEMAEKLRASYSRGMSV